MSRHARLIPLMLLLAGLQFPAAVSAAEPAAPLTLAAEHGVVCRLPGERFGYFDWPTVARTDDGRLLMVSSGLRSEHVCPFGKTVLHASTDDGRTWSESRVKWSLPAAKP
jgi:hypothetical protein